MALSDFLGKTVEIEIIDFLAVTMESDYTLEEINNLITVSDKFLKQKIDNLINNNILISIERFNIRYYKLADNRITKNLIKAAFAHSFEMIDKK